MNDGLAFVDELICAKRQDQPRKAIFTGCSLAAAGEWFLGDLLDELYARGVADSMITLCCGKMLAFMDSDLGEEEYLGHLRDALCASGLEEIVVGCPSCYYTLKMLLDEFACEGGPLVHALPSALARSGCCLGDEVPDNLSPVTFHDSCPDKQEGVFANATRGLFGKCGKVELPHHQACSMCCSGNPQFEDEEDCERASSEYRAREAMSVGAMSIVTYCMRCTRMLSQASQRIDGPEVHHYLEYLVPRKLAWGQGDGEAPCVFLK